jgi:hypothetical protein
MNAFDESEPDGVFDDLGTLRVGELLLDRG